jgi:hypothetical protein
VIVAVAGRSNGLGPTVAGNTILPVISCPPLSADWGAQDVWSSLRLPSGLLYLLWDARLVMIGISKMVDCLYYGTVRVDYPASCFD